MPTLSHSYILKNNKRRRDRYKPDSMTDAKKRKNRLTMAAREDDDYWNVKYAEASCYEHGDENMWYDELTGEWVCGLDDSEDEEDE